MSNINSKSMRKFSYGLFVLSTKLGERTNACISNTAIQISSGPLSLGLAVNKGNLTHDMILDSGEFNLSILHKEAPFEVFELFGLKSGRDIDKFSQIEHKFLENGIPVLPQYANAVMSAKVVNTVDCGTHTLFVAEITEADVVSAIESMTYDYYFAEVKPKPKKAKGYVCKICNYVYEGESLPADYVCPLCAHGVEYFEEIV